MTKAVPKVSILVPIYNVSRYIRECMDSLVSQTLEDIEIICINDGSTDDSLELLNEYAENDSRVIVITKPNGGLPSARNAALNAARGEYVGFVDSDDYVSQSMFDVMYKTALDKKSEIVVCGAVPFPDEPAPGEWIKNVLSPRDIHYPRFTKELLFEERGARPYVWRMLVKRSLIEKNKIRFEESIIIGEDQGFQLRIYPMARGVTFISDKLYFYRWWREGSIMNSGVYHDYSKRVFAHIALVDHIKDSWSESGDMDSMRKEFLEWSVDLIYDDLIKLSILERTDASKEICDIWNECLYWSCKGTFSAKHEDMFDYTYSLYGREYSEPEVTVVVTVNNNRYWFESCIKSILNQTKKDIEVICINNGTNDGSFALMHSVMRKDHRISLFNQDTKSDMECWQLGLANSKGRYVIFIDSSDRLILNNALEIACSLMEDGTDAVCFNAYNNYLVEPVGVKIDSFKEHNFNEFRKFLSIHQFIFRTSYVYPLVREIPDCSWFNEWMFMTKVQKGNGKVNTTPDCLYGLNEVWMPDKIAAWQANMILDAAIELVKESWEPGFIWIQGQVISRLNSDYMIRLIVDSTRPSVKRMSEDPNGLASEAGTWCKILDLNSIVDVSKCERSLLRIVEVYVTERHRFLNELS